MQIAQRLAGYTLGSADLLRRAMGKKKPEEMAKQKSTFVDGALANGVSRSDAERIFGLLEFFAGYGFNKSHSAAYAVLTYQTAYLKAHYPVEFLCALMTADRERTEKVVRIIAEGRAWGVEILPPEINESKIDFTVVYSARAPGSSVERGRWATGKKAKRRLSDPLDPKIRFGLGAVRGVGESALEALLDARKDGPFDDLFDLSQRVDVRRINKAVLEPLVQCGAFDASLQRRGVTRAQALVSIDRALERGKSASRDRECGQTNLFGLFGQEAGATLRVGDYIAAEPWDLSETLKREKQSLGFYVSGHPLDRYGVELGRFEVVPVKNLAGMDPWARVRVAGTVEGYRERTFRSGGKVAFFNLEDLSGAVDVKVREKQLERVGDLLTSGEPVLVTGKLQVPMGDDADGFDPRPSDPTLVLDEVVLLGEAIRSETRGMAIRLVGDGAAPQQLERLRELLGASPGPCPVQIIIDCDDGAQAVLSLGPELFVEPNDRLLSSLERLFGSGVAELR